MINTQIINSTIRYIKRSFRNIKNFIRNVKRINSNSGTSSRTYKTTPGPLMTQIVTLENFRKLSGFHQNKFGLKIRVFVCWTEWKSNKPYWKIKSYFLFLCSEDPEKVIFKDCYKNRNFELGRITSFGILFIYSLFGFSLLIYLLSPLAFPGLI